MTLTGFPIMAPRTKNELISKSDLRANISGDGHHFLAMAITHP